MTFTIPQPILPHLASLHLSPSIHSLSFFALPDPNPPTKLTPKVKKVRDLVHAALPPFVENHSYRCYAWGLIIADLAGWTKPEFGWDPELWLIAALFHDIGCARECRAKSVRLSFEIWGGIKAREYLLKWGADEEVADEVCEAIVRHTEKYDVGCIRLITALMQLTPSQDFRGIFTPIYIHPQDVDTVSSLYPRLGMIHHFADVFLEEVDRKPGCLSEIWARRVLKQIGTYGDESERESIEVFEGLQGERGDGIDQEWELRRKDVTL